MIRTPSGFLDISSVLIYGFSGFLGSRIGEYFRNLGCQVETSTLHENSMPLVSPDIIFHCAMDYDSIINQVAMDSMLLNMMRFYPETKLVVFGSNRMYSPNVVRSEVNCCSGDLVEDKWYGYAMGKRMLYTMLRNSKIKNWFYFIPPALIGGGFNLEQNTHMVHQIARKVVIAKKTGKEMVFEDKNSYREQLWVKDFIDNMVQLISMNESKHAINLGGSFLSPEEIVKMCCKEMGVSFSRALFQSDIGRSVAPMSSAFAKMKLGANYKNNFANGLKEVLDYVDREFI